MADIEKIGIKINVSDNDSASRINEIAKAIDNLKTSLNGLKDVNKQLSSLSKIFNGVGSIKKSTGSKSTGKLNKDKITVDESKLASPIFKSDKSDIKSIVNTQQASEIFGKYAKNVMATTKEVSGLNKEISKTDKPTKKATNSFSKFVRAIGRIAFYRAIRYALREIAQAFKEGFANFVKFDKATNQSASNVMNSFNQLKNTLGVTAGYLLQAFEPIITTLTDGLIDLVNNINMALASIEGKNTYKKAIKQNEDYSESLDKVNGKLLDFDTFKTLGTDSSSSSEDLFQEYAMPDELNTTASIFKDIFEIVKELVDLIIDVIKALKPALPSILNLVKNIIEVLEEPLINIINAVSDILTKAINSLLPSIISLINTAIPVINEILEILDPIIDVIITLAKILADSLIVDLKILLPYIKICVAILEPFLNIANTILGGIADVIEKIVGFITDIINKIKNSKIGSFFSNIFSTVSDWTSSAWGSIKNFFGFANGGTYQTGDFFVANENGATELVASSNSGGSVMNIEQWESVSYSSFYRALSDYNAAKDGGSSSGMSLTQIGRAIASNSGFVNEMNRRNSSLNLI